LDQKPRVGIGILVYYREEALKRGAKAEASYLSETAASS